MNAFSTQTNDVQMKLRTEKNVFFAELCTSVDGIAHNIINWNLWLCKWVLARILFRMFWLWNQDYFDNWNLFLLTHSKFWLLFLALMLMIITLVLNTVRFKRDKKKNWQNNFFFGLFKKSHIQWVLVMILKTDQMQKLFFLKFNINFQFATWWFFLVRAHSLESFWNHFGIIGWLKYMKIYYFSPKWTAHYAYICTLNI